MSSRLSRYAVLVFLVSSGLLLAESFVVKKNKKKPITKVLKESCRDCLFDTLTKTPITLEKFAQEQQSIMRLVPSMFDGSFFSGIKKEELRELASDFETFAHRQETINQLLAEQTAFLGSLEKKYQQ